LGADDNTGDGSPSNAQPVNASSENGEAMSSVIVDKQDQAGEEKTQDSVGNGQANSVAEQNAPVLDGNSAGQEPADSSNEAKEAAIPPVQQREIHYPGGPMPEASPNETPSQKNLDTPKLAQPIATSRTYVPPVKPAYTNSSLATAGAFSSLVLGIIALVASCFTIAQVASLFPAVLGIAMGIWGIFSNQRTIALVGLAFCVLAFGVGLFHVSIWIFRLMYGISPFAEGVNEISA
jgi:hypothetical protein